MKRQATFNKPIIHDEAIFTSMTKYGDNDCIARLFCKNHGRISVFINRAFGIKRKKSPLQVPSTASVAVKKKQNSDFWQLNSLDIYSYNYNLASNLKSYGYSCYLVELIEVFFAPQDRQEKAFELFFTAIKLLANEPANPVLLRALELKLLNICGYLPDLNDKKLFSKQQKCNFFLLQSNDRIVFNEDARIIALELLTSDLDKLPAVDLSILKLIGQIFALELRSHIKYPLKSVKFLNSLREKEV